MNKGTLKLVGGLVMAVAGIITGGTMIYDGAKGGLKSINDFKEQKALAAANEETEDEA